MVIFGSRDVEGFRQEEEGCRQEEEGCGPPCGGEEEEVPLPLERPWPWG